MALSTQAVASKYQKLDEYLETLSANDKMMVSVELEQNGKTVYSKQVGYANVESQQKLTENSRFRVGSISKTVTATVVMKLKEMGKLKLSDTLDSFYPEIENAKDITIEHLLSHRSGIFNFTNDRTYPGYMLTPQSKSDLLKIIAAFPSQFVPGSEHEYSNSNYVLLGYIAEDVSGKTLRQLVADHIAKPLELKNTYLADDSPRAKEEVFSYRYTGQWQRMPDTAMSIPFGAGAVVSTASDINMFMTGLFTGKLVSNDSLEQMKKINQGYGFGLMQFPFYERRALGHNGGIDGFVSNASFIEEEQLALTVLANGVNYEFNGVLIAALSSYFDKPFDVPDFSATAIELSDEQLKAFVGEFESKQLPMDIKVFMQGEQLMAQATGQGPFPLTPFGVLEFRFEPAGIVLVFDTEKRSFELFQGGGKYQFTIK